MKSLRFCRLWIHVGVANRRNCDSGARRSGRLVRVKPCSHQSKVHRRDLECLPPPESHMGMLR
jgi:hypothetical protein